ncbi:MAG TPA: tetraacyldisaccharide 4'-kinase, partial [Hyphomonas sp.]|nr:tetraacyldisaccharide 4'-kinase [Hyphomonas sp.]
GSACQEDTASIISTLSLSGPIYERMVAIDADALNDRSALMLSRILRDYRRSGVDKDEATRTRVEELNAELAEISTEFSKNLREIVGQVEVDSVDALEGLPQ